MKTICTLLLIGVLSTLSKSSNAQFTEDFEGGLSSLSGNCWNLTQINHSSDGTVPPITGTGSLYSNPPTSILNPRIIETPQLNINSTSLTISFNYKLSSPINGNATRTVEVGLKDVNGIFISLQLIIMNKFSPATVQNFNQTFTLPSTCIRRVVIKLGGAIGDGNTRLIFDDLFVSASPHYGPASFCNSAPIAVDDVFTMTSLSSIVMGNVMANDNEPNGEIMNASIVTPLLPALGNLVFNSNGSFIFTPAPGFVGPSATFTYNLVDEGYEPATSNTATVTINYLGTLPVKLIDFTAKYTKPNVSLNWSTAQEKNFSHFVLQQSSDGINFSDLAVVFGAGESDSRQDYSYVDKTLAGRKGLVYYRLLSVDIDNKAAYSTVRIIRLSDDVQKVSITTYPNPVNNELRITVPADWQSKKVVYEIVNANGQVAKRMQTANSSQTETINTSNLAPGFYIARVTCDGVTTQQKIVKQ